ncbi:MAG: N-acetyltransferase [Bacillales bacterium]|jgi:ribosomal-protein-alanine N-acetyltransferase|nr:N-acetyltransferase [Bacillales bacterium]
MRIFNKFPVLETNRLVLKDVSLHHSEEAFEFYSDPEVMRGHGESGLKTLDEVRERIQQWYINPFEKHTGIRFGIFLKDTNRLIGSCGFWRIEEQHFKAEIGYELSSKFHRKGYMKESLKELVRFGFLVMKLNRIEANTDQYNLASQNTLESVGFVKEGVRKEAEYENGSFLDMHSYALLKKEWEEGQLRG